MKVLAIIGSPRKGHTFALVQRLAELLRERGDVDVELVMLRDLDQKSCRGCYACQSRGEHRCPIDDGVDALVERMKTADGVMLASPTYTSNVSGLMKGFMDRLAWAAHRPPFLGKPAMLVTTASSFTGGALRALSWFGYTGFDVVAKVGWSVWPSPRRQWKRSAGDERKLRRAVTRLWDALHGPPAPLSLAHVLQLSVATVTPATDPEFFAADAAFHREVGARLREAPWWKCALGGFAAWLVGLAASHQLVDRPRRPGL